MIELLWVSVMASFIFFSTHTMESEVKRDDSAKILLEDNRQVDEIVIEGE